MSRRRVIQISLAGLALVFFILWPTINVLRVRHSLASSLEGATSVRLEEFVSHFPLVSVELPHGEWLQVLAATPPVPDVGVPGTIKMCFIPHHRVVVVGPQQRRFVFTVCFACDQLHTKSIGIFCHPVSLVQPIASVVHESRNPPSHRPRI